MAGPVMPSPARAAAKGITVCKRAGLTEGEACAMIVAVCDAVIRHPLARPGLDWTWVYQVQAAARTRLARTGRR